MFFGRPSSLLLPFSLCLSCRLSPRRGRAKSMSKTVKAMQAIEAIGTITAQRTSVVGRRTVDAGVAIIGGFSAGSAVEMVLCHGYDTIPGRVRELPQAAV
jgi:hypothetical protein